MHALKCSSDGDKMETYLWFLSVSAVMAAALVV